MSIKVHVSILWRDATDQFCYEFIINRLIALLNISGFVILVSPRLASPSPAGKKRNWFNSFQNMSSICQFTISGVKCRSFTLIEPQIMGLSFHSRLYITNVSGSFEKKLAWRFLEMVLFALAILHKTYCLKLSSSCWRFSFPFRACLDGFIHKFRILAYVF